MKSLDLRISVLRMFIGKELYGYEIYKKLRSEGVEIGVGRLYKILIEMKRTGLLESRWESSNKGPNKRVYKISKKGKQELNQVIMSAIHTVLSSYSEYLMTLPPESNIFNTIAKLSTDELEKASNVGFVVTDSSPMNEQTIQAIRRNSPDSKVYIVKPRSVDFEIWFENTTYLEGLYGNLPFKDGFLNFLFVIGIPNKKNLQGNLQEWVRVLKENGKLSILIPSILLNAPSNPLNLGDFIERWEHQIFQNSEILGLNFIETSLQNSGLLRIKVRQIAHMTLILASKSELLCRLS